MGLVRDFVVISQCVFVVSQCIVDLDCKVAVAEAPDLIAEFGGQKQ
jgi:hypothetical protein